VSRGERERRMNGEFNPTSSSPIECKSEEMTKHGSEFGEFNENRFAVEKRAQLENCTRAQMGAKHLWQTRSALGL